MTKAACLMRLLVKSYALFSLYNTLRWQTPAAMSNEARAILHEHYHCQLALFAAMARHVLKLGGGCSTKLAPAIQSIERFDAHRRTCPADYLRALLAAHQTVLAETRALTSVPRTLSTAETAEIVGLIAQTNELQIRIVAGQLSAPGHTKSGNRRVGFGQSA
jgi:hypothetical protein